MDVLNGIPFADLTAPTLLGIAVLMLLSGRLFSKAAWQDKADEAERWRKAYEAERESRVTADAQTAELLELAKTTHAFITAVFSNSERIRQSGEPNALSPTKDRS